MNTLRTCLLCGATLMGRSDKKFCDDHCRSQHYHNQHRNQSSLIRFINKQLKHNRNVLFHFYHSKCTPVISLEALKKLGFLPDYHTHIYMLKNGTELKMYYDFGYLLKDPNTIRIYSPVKSRALIKWYDKISNTHSEI
ncbi:MAG: hypothetical protein IPM92_13275 [Saprospiraceae bacterium]|nr:hypothetical protein [Saprospiraceae bacterium]